MNIAGWHSVIIDSDFTEGQMGRWTAGVHWCKEHFGDGVGANKWFYAGIGDFRFEKSQDAFLFKLRWAY